MAIETAPKAAYFMVLSGFTYIYFFVIPRLDRISDSLDAAATRQMLSIMDEIKHSQQSIHELYEEKSD
ncbi:hypothetical protein PVAP13_7NG158817 [Panicum virgatum]|uniref:Uncharacterized protein n=1 Tax=Panicum virgatum TaxID=38727 RepID=A0A8T0Q091_PANVG|nr:hypothetical protein PVAP13_7NG158817 [Panicum virgatum]